MEFITQFINQFTKLPNYCIKELDAILETKLYSKKSIIINANDVSSKFYVLKTGIITAFIIDAKGKEFMRSLFVTPQLVGSLAALITKTPSYFTFECHTDCEVIEGDFNLFIKLVDKHKPIADLYTTVLEDAYVRLNERLSEFALYEATDRFLNLKKKIPNIEELIPQYHIASYLSITPVQLSRIRKNILKK